MTVLPVPTAAVLNAALPVHATTSPPTAPVTLHVASVALVIPSYGLFAAVTAGATLNGVIEAVPVAALAPATRFRLDQQQERQVRREPFGREAIPAAGALDSETVAVVDVSE